MISNVSPLFAISGYRSEAKSNYDSNYVKTIGNYFIASKAEQISFYSFVYAFSRVHSSKKMSHEAILILA